MSFTVFFVFHCDNWNDYANRESNSLVQYLSYTILRLHYLKDSIDMKSNVDL
jgi:hypothetical protein